MSALLSRYFRTGPMTPEKRQWIEQQIEALSKSNRELAMRIKSDGVSLTVNEHQIQVLRNILWNNSL